MRKIFILIFIPYLLLCNEYDETPRTRTGFWYGYNYNIHNIKNFQFNELWNCCPEMKNAYGFGSNVGVFLELPLGYDVYFGLKTSYRNLFGIYNKKIWDSELNIGSNVLYDQELKLNLSTIGIDMYLSGYFYDNYYFNAGYRLSYFNNKEYEYNYTSVDGLNVNEINSKKGHFKELSDLLFSLEFTVGYDYSLDDKKLFRLSPEITYSTTLFDIYPETYWKINSLGFNLKFTYAPEYVEDVLKEIYIYDTLVVYKPNIDKEFLKFGISEKYNYTQREGKYNYIVTEIKRIDTLVKPLEPLQPKLEVLGLMPSGKAQQINTVLIKSQLRKQVNTLLPYIFFDKFSSELPERYLGNNFVENNQVINCNTALCYNRNVLNIVGDYLLKNPQSKVSLKGYVDKVTEGIDCNLAHDRALSVKNYLKSFGIDESRILIDTTGSCYWYLLDTDQDVKRYEENQKVVIKVDDKDFMEPVISDWYLETEFIVPEKLIFDISDNDWDNTKQWQFSLGYNGKELLYITGTDVRESLEYNFSKQDIEMLNPDEPLIAQFIVKDKYGRNYTTSENINVVVDTANYKFSSFNIVLFDYSNYVLTKEMRDNLAKFLEQLDEDSELYIYGYTDILGDDEYNKKLAKARAFQTAYYITQINPKIKISSIVGYATDKFAPGINSYDTPEERVLSRTVEIQIRSVRK